MVNNYPEYHQFLLDLGEVELDLERLSGYEVYRRTDLDLPSDLTIFAIIKRHSTPLLIDIASDWQLSQKLQADYESILPSKIMDSKTWIRVIDSGQVETEQLKDFLRLAYNLVAD